MKKPKFKAGDKVEFRGRLGEVLRYDAEHREYIVAMWGDECMFQEKELKLRKELP